MTPETVTHLVELAIGALISITLGTMAFLVQRSIKGVDDHLSDQDKHLSRQDGKLDGLASKWSEHDRALAVHEMRLSRLDADDSVRRAEHEQFAGFLQTLGFKRSTH